MSEEGPATVSNPVFDALCLLEQKVGTVTAAEAVPKSELLKLTVSFGEETNRTVLARIGKFFKAEELVGNQYVFVTNLPPRPMKGIMSEAMIFAAKDGETMALMQPTKAVASGTRLG